MANASKRQTATRVCVCALNWPGVCVFWFVLTHVHLNVLLSCVCVFYIFYFYFFTSNCFTVAETFEALLFLSHYFIYSVFSYLARFSFFFLRYNPAPAAVVKRRGRRRPGRRLDRGGIFRPDVAAAPN